MILVIHLILSTLATLFGWDVIRRLSPVAVPGVVARVVIAGLGTVLWIWCPVSILVGMAIVGVLMFLGPYISVESHRPWGSDLKDSIIGYRQTRGQVKTKRVVEEKVSQMGKRFEVKDKVGSRIPKL